MVYVIIFIKRIFLFPSYFYYHIYDKLIYHYFHKNKEFYGWGIHLYTGKFGQGKTSLMTIQAYKLCKKYPQLHVVTNINLTNFPEHTRILPLNTAEDILNAPNNSLILIDEIGTLFNSRDFASGKNSVPKPVFQHLCQCRKKHLQIMATVQRFNLLDKQIRDISASVTTCKAHGKHPFSRELIGITYDIDEYEAYASNKMYVPRADYSTVVIQKDQYRQLYDTSQLIQGLLKMEYLSDEEILRNQGTIDVYGDGSKEALKAYKKATRKRRQQGRGTSCGRPRPLRNPPTLTGGYNLNNKHKGLIIWLL